MATTVSKNENSVVMLEVLLPLRRLLNYTVLAYGCDEHPVMEATELSNVSNVPVMHHNNIITLCSQAPMTFRICPSILLILV